MDNLEIYNKVKLVPEEAQKTIKGGRTAGFTDINPMWRIKTLTEQFGMCGIGWKAPVKKFWLEPGANGEISAFCEIELFVKVGDNWSDGITGIGGSAFVASETKGLYTSDECYKMAYTDALSVSCKMLGFGADIYWGKDKTKYDTAKDETTPATTNAKLDDVVSQQNGKLFCTICDEEITSAKSKQYYKDHPTYQVKCYNCNQNR